MSRSAAIDGPRAAAAFSAAMLAAVLWPIRQNWRVRPRDGFPLSYYPMFTRARRDTLSVTYLVGRDADGQRHFLPYRYAGHGGLNQVRKQIGTRLAGGGGDALCRAVWEQAAHDRSATRPPLSEVAAVTGLYGISEWFAGQRDPLHEDVRGTYSVPSR